MAIDGFEDDDFIDIEPVSSKKSRADLVMRVIKPRQGNNRKIQFNLASVILSEINIDERGGRLAVQWSPAKRAFRLKAEKGGVFEVMSPAKGEGRRLVRAPLPAGLFDNEGEAEPEFYVDAIGKQIIIECPELFLRPKFKMLTGPVGPASEPSREAPRNPGAAVDDGKVLRAALGITDTMPRTIDGHHFKPAEAAVLHLLATRELVTKEAVMIATANPENPNDDERNEKIVDVYLCKIRPQLSEMGIAVQTDWGNGYKLSRADRTKLKNLIELARMEGEA